VDSSAHGGVPIGDLLRQARQQAGMTQEELATRAGLSVRAISDLERGLTANPRRSSVQLLMDALGLSEPTQAPHTGTLAGGLYAITPVLPGYGTGAASFSMPMAPRPAQLPVDISDFTGRSERAEELCALLAGNSDAGRGAASLVVVTGGGGLGKTTLAVHAAHLVADQFPDGQLYANLHGTTWPTDPTDVLARFLRDLGAEGSHLPTGEEELAARYRTRLAGRRTLIVLDDAQDARQVEPLLPGSSSCAVLVTTRNHMPDLARAGMIDLASLSKKEAHALFMRIVGPLRVTAEPDATEQVLTVCAGLPLAVRIVGARLAARGGWTVRALADRLSDESRRLDELRTGNLAVGASFEVSYTSLPTPATPRGVSAAHAFRLLGLWNGPSISLPAAAALLGEPDTQVAPALEVMVDAHLLESPSPDTYRFHDLIRV
jgi:transcriptional regulator with XRE-family HTH domain